MVLFSEKRRRMDFLVKIYFCTTLLQCEFLQGEYSKTFFSGKQEIQSIWEFAVDTSAQGIIAQALYLGDPNMYNNTMDSCIWKRGNDRDACPDPDITMILYTSGRVRTKSVVSGTWYLHSQVQKVIVSYAAGYGPSWLVAQQWLQSQAREHYSRTRVRRRRWYSPHGGTQRWWVHLLDFIDKVTTDIALNDSALILWYKCPEF